MSSSRRGGRWNRKEARKREVEEKRKSKQGSLGVMVREEGNRGGEGAGRGREREKEVESPMV